jgi:nucleoside-diphosphate-sugar epimerase
VDNLVDAMLLAAQVPEAHGRRFIVNDGTTTWKHFLSPLLGELRDRIPSLTRDDLVSMNRTLRPGVGDVVRAVVADPETRALAKRTSVGNRAYQLSQRIAPRGVQRLKNGMSPRQQSGHGIPADKPKPPVWLADLFGPETYSLSSQRARDVLGWAPAVTLECGQEITAAWLRDADLTLTYELGAP